MKEGGLIIGLEQGGILQHAHTILVALLPVPAAYGRMQLGP